MSGVLTVCDIHGNIILFGTLNSWAVNKDGNISVKIVKFHIPDLERLGVTREGFIIPPP